MKKICFCNPLIIRNINFICKKIEKKTYKILQIKKKVFTFVRLIR
jgi:hypothetical protein